MIIRICQLSFGNALSLRKIENKNVENDCYSQKQAEKDDFLVKMFPSLPMNWQTSLSDSSKALHYRIFKTKFEFEEYFNIWNIGDAIRLCRCRTNNHYLRIETGRWRNIDRGNRYCKLCNCQKLGDEYQVCFRVFLFKR